jgi:hypothetical protein
MVQVQNVDGKMFNFHKSWFKVLQHIYYTSRDLM